jgi:DNA-binding NarL/FixJ family response regulator
MGERHSKTKCILIVDDNAIIRRSLRRILESVDGWQVCDEAVDGQDGIEMAKELTPDLIIVDLSMPRLNGLEAARALSKTMPELPLLMFSTHMDHLAQKEAIATGVSAVLPRRATWNAGEKGSRIA